MKLTNTNKQDLHYFDANSCQEDGINSVIQDNVDHARANYEAVKRKNLTFRC